jgi:hypothetical protein
MNEERQLTLTELSEKSKRHFESREWQEAANCLNAARELYGDGGDEILVQDSDGSIKVQYQEEDNRGAFVTKRRELK